MAGLCPPWLGPIKENQNLNRNLLHLHYIITCTPRCHYIPMHMQIYKSHASRQGTAALHNTIIQSYPQEEARSMLIPTQSILNTAHN